ncbi:MAG: DUF3108 domain-containing protein [Proteobacteria bacterium]|nr:DUF3108 domain-containing protein [Pseudomonadota bacterium]
MRIYMDMPVRLCNIPCLFLFIIALCATDSHAHAAEALLPLKLRAVYNFEYAGIVFGSAGLEMTQDENAFDAVSDVTSSGIARIFVKHDSHSVAKGTGKHYTYSDVDYDSHYQTRSKKKAAHLVWSDGVLAKEELQPAETGKRPPVEAALKNNALDPLRFGLALRQQLFEAMQAGKKNYSLRVFDGRRLTQADFAIKGSATVSYLGQKLPVTRVDVTRTLLEGFTESELQEAADKKDPPLRMYFTQDERLIPVVLEVPLMLGRVRAVLARECSAGESCLLGLNP